ncbi:Dynamin-1-like protein isoform X2 [Oopsacas minuta]|uniref:Dynamin-1-like protein isoform X2 n=1 Tax=Oopsacas minuta TaxID=111878 RepID=A0AAV7K1W9_9METZ|nr:Dynamin-1-like protein isoform X2 [Oopsacas minuta]
MENLIPVINKLQDIFNTVGFEAIHLPQIVVVGTQSSGKSSVLENIVGKSFLPRGTGIVTRRPLILQLIHSENIEANEESGENPWGYGVFLHRGEHKYYNFDDICLEIQQDTDKVSGGNKGISAEAITLRIYSPHVLNLTLCDLPGITRVPVGDQPEDIESQTKEIVYNYITNPNSIILVVHAANTDLAVCEALKIAQQVDPEGLRTLMVCTKIDLMDAGTDAVELLTGKIIPVKMGIVGAVNRSQQDIISKKLIETALKDEAEFFRRKYPGLAAKNGSIYLANLLSHMLMNHIRKCLPELKSRVTHLTFTYQNQIAEFGYELTEKGPLLLNIIHRFSSSYAEAIEGRAKNIDVSKLYGGARICFIFHETFADKINDIKPLTTIGSYEIITAMRNSAGTRSSLFVPEVAFDLLVKQQIEKLKEPSLKCVQLIFEEMQKILLNCIKGIPELERFYLLEEKILDIVYEVLRDRLPVTNEMVENLIKIELAYINTSHPDFETLKSIQDPRNIALYNPQPAVTQLPNEPKQFPPPAQTQGSSSSGLFGYFGKAGGEDMEPPQDTIEHEATASSLSQKTENVSLSITEKNTRDCAIIQQLIDSYFNIVRKNILDSIPKTVMHFLVNFVKDNIQNQLVVHLYKPSVYESLLKEAEYVTDRREEVSSMLDALRKASQTINQLRDPDFQHRKNFNFMS